MKKIIIVAYDISNDKTRTDISNLLKPFGDRVNKSVFECMFNENEFREVKEELIKRIEYDDDRIVFYRICRECCPRS